MPVFSKAPVAMLQSRHASSAPVPVHTTVRSCPRPLAQPPAMQYIIYTLLSKTQIGTHPASTVRVVYITNHLSSTPSKIARDHAATLTAEHARAGSRGLSDSAPHCLFSTFHHAGPPRGAAARVFVSSPDKQWFQLCVDQPWRFKQGFDQCSDRERPAP